MNAPARSSIARFLLTAVLTVTLDSAGADTVLAQALPAWVTDAVREMTPAQRVGQLFVVPFEGADVGDGSTIADFVATSHIGGVILDPARGNIPQGLEAPADVARLANALQARAAADGAYVPLLIAIRQKGDVAPESSLVGGMTPLPSPMALGATWDPDQAERVGDLVGRELAAVGVNLLLGPDLDVVAEPRPAASGDRGSRSFGGSPQWVGRMGARYIEGVHTGSGGRVATAAGQFPGIGSVDRSPDTDVAVVEKPFSALLAGELAAFETVVHTTRPGAVTDALMTSHVRYRGIQQQPDRPLSLDSGGLRYLWAQVPSLGAWRTGGGVLISPGLGLPAVRKYNDPALAEFNHRRVIREALGAGHDLLLVEGFGDGDARSEAAAIKDGIDWLTVTYEEDEAVRETVDAAVARILTLKRRLYPNLSLVEVEVDAEAAAAETGVGMDVTRSVAREALTRIGGAGSAPPAPRLGNHVLFVVDARVERRCDDCPEAAVPDPELIAGVARRTYGSAGTHRVEDEDVGAITFAELAVWLGDPEGAGPSGAGSSPERQAQVEALVNAADYLVFVLRQPRQPPAPGADALASFLAAGPVRADQRLIVLALGAPYYLDTTEIARLDAYYAAYAAVEPFIEAAVRAVFGDEPAPGASPVSVPGAGYELARALEPARADLTLEVVGRSADRPVELGAQLTVRTAAIFDANGHVVPDGTQVTFRSFDLDEGLFQPDVEAQTESGRATALLRAERSGELEITAVFANGARSLPLPVLVEGDGAAPAPPPAAPAQLVVPAQRPPVDWGILVLSLTVILLPGAVLYGSDPSAANAPGRILRVFLVSVCWGLAGYLIVAAGGIRLGDVGPVTLWPRDWSDAYQAPLFSFVLALGAVMPSLAAALRGSSQSEE